MDTTLIMFAVVFLVLVYLIFKFIKKLVYAIFTLILLCVLVVAGIAGVVYMDYTYLTSQSDFDLKVVYSKDNSYLFGSNINIVNKTPDLKSIKSISSTELSSLKPQDVSTGDKVFVVVFDEELLKLIMTKDSYKIPGFDSVDSLKKYDLSLTKFEVIEVLDAVDANAKYFEIIEKKNKLSVVEKTLFETVGKNMLESELKKQGISLKEAVFLTVISDEIKVEKNSLILIQGFKDEKLQVYPERFTFKLVRMLPISTIQGFISK